MGQEVILYKLKEKKTFLSKIAKKCCFPGKIRQEFYLDSSAEEYDGLEPEKEFHHRKLPSKAKILWDISVGIENFIQVFLNFCQG